MKVLFISSGNNQNGISPLIKSQGESLIKAGVELEYFLVIGRGFRGYVNAISKLRSWLKMHTADLIHAHYGLCGWVAYLAKPKRVPLVLSYMGSDLFPIKKGRIAPNALVGRLSRAMQNRADRIIVKSENLKQAISRMANLAIIPNGVDINHFRPLAKKDCRQQLGLPSERQIVLFLGNPDDGNKNIQLVKNAFASIGPTEPLLLSPFPIDPGQVPLFLNAADVFVLSSISEGSPNVVKEAMACNCPIVATEVGDVCDVLGNTPGCFVSSSSPDEMAAKIKLALDFNNRTSGRERIIGLGMDSDSIAKRIIAVYETTLSLSR